MAKATKTLRMDLDIFAALDSICERHGDVTWHIEKALRSYGPIKKALGQSESSKPKQKKQEVIKGDKIGQLPLPDGSAYYIYEADVDKWASLYPGADIMQELRNMYGWLDSNPAKRKTEKGLPRFITNWLSRVQNNGQNTKHQQLSTTGRSQKPTSAAARVSEQARQVFANAEAREAAGGFMGADDSAL